MYISGKEAKFSNRRKEVCTISSDKGLESFETATRGERLFNIMTDTGNTSHLFLIPILRHYQLQGAFNISDKHVFAS